MTPKYVLDTSALCSHFLRQGGCDEVERLLAEQPEATGVCVLTWFEMRYVLQRCGFSRADAVRALRLYRELPLEVCPVTDAVVDRAIEIRDEAAGRLPMADALIAGCASLAGAVLVHRDDRFDRLPARMVKQLRLPDQPPARPASSDDPPTVREVRAAYKTRARRKP